MCTKTILFWNICNMQNTNYFQYWQFCFICHSNWGFMSNNETFSYLFVSAKYHTKTNSRAFFFMSLKKLLTPYNQDTMTTSINAHNIIFQVAETLSSKSNIYNPPLKHMESPPVNMKMQTRMVTKCLLLVNENWSIITVIKVST